MMAFVVKALRTLFFSLDKIIYGLIGNVYALLLQIARTSVFSQAQIAEFAERIYALAGIFMLFKVSFSLINYIVNPDAFADKEKGLASLGKRACISLALLVLSPYIFQEAYELQRIVLEENVLMTLVMGNTTINGLDTGPSTYAEMAGEEIQFALMYTFMQPNYEEMADALGSCKETYVWDGTHMQYEGNSHFQYKLNESCFGTYDESSGYQGGVLGDYFEESEAKDYYQNYAYGIANRNFYMLMRLDLVLAKVEDVDDPNHNEYLINYKMLVSTIVGGAVVYLLLILCIDVAVRSVKLAFLQMISPVPILSYIEPKSGRDGMFKKWLDMCSKTYLSLFLRLFALYLGVYAIMLITLGGGFVDTVTNETVNDWILTVFMIIGILIFVKQLPKIIEDIFGVKLDGKFTLNPLKKLEDEMIGGKRITGAVAGGLAGISAGNMVGGFLHGAAANKGFTGAWKDQAAYNQKLRDARANGSTMLGRAGAGITRTLGLPNQSESLQRQEKHIDEQIKDIDNSIKPTKDSIADRKAYTDKVSAMESRAKEKIQNGEAGEISRKYLELKNEAERRKQAGTYSAAQIAEAEIAASNYLNNVGMEDYMDICTGHRSDARVVNAQGNATGGVVAHGISGGDAAMVSMYEDLQSMAKTSHTYKTGSSDPAKATVTIDMSAATSNAHSRHGNAGLVTGSVNYDTREVINPAEGRKQSLSQSKARLHERERRASANNTHR